MPPFRVGKPHWRVGLTSLTTLAAGANDIPWQVALEEDPDVWDIAAPTQVTLDRSGLYLLVLQVGRNTVALTSSISGRIQRNGVNASSSGTTASTTATQQCMSVYLGELDAGDVLTANVTLHGTLSASLQTALTWFSGARVGPVRWT